MLVLTDSTVLLAARVLPTVETVSLVQDLPLLKVLTALIVLLPNTVLTLGNNHALNLGLYVWLDLLSLIGVLSARKLPKLEKPLVLTVIKANIVLSQQ